MQIKYDINKKQFSLFDFKDNVHNWVLNKTEGGISSSFNNVIPFPNIEHRFNLNNVFSCQAVVHFNIIVILKHKIYIKKYQELKLKIESDKIIHPMHK